MLGCGGLGMEESMTAEEKFVATAREIDEQADRITQLEEALGDVIDVAIWMSGSPSFGPDGEAGEHWPSQRDRIHKAMAVLKK